MAQRTRIVDPDLLPHPRPCWCPECRSAYNRIWRDTHPGYMDEWARKQHHRCKTCDIQMTGWAAYCSRECRPGGRNHSTRIGYCSECGAAFPKNGGNRKRCPDHFLGDSNKGRPRGKRGKPGPKVLAECRWCHREYSVSAGLEEKRITCSTDCRNQLTWHHGRYGYSDRAPLPTCVVCGDLTGKPPPQRREDYGLTSTRFRCSKHEVLSDEAIEAQRNARRRRRESVKAGETFTVHDLIDRDGDGCHLCGDPVRFDVDPHAHPAYGTIDHLVPIADGGEHTMANAAVAHRHCNNVRGTRGIVQLRLVG